MNKRKTFTLQQWQEKMRQCYFDKDNKRGTMPTFAWLVEEIGELATALLNNNKDAAREEIADVIAWTLSLANLLGIDVEEAMLLKYGDTCTK